MDLDKPDTITQPCPCESGKPHAQCCGPLLIGEKTAQTPEELMRSRYCAYKAGEIDYILKTWHPDTRPAGIEPDSLHNWCGLEILHTSKGGMEHTEGFVEFRATAQVGLTKSFLHEKSRFVKEGGIWLYVDGEMVASNPEQSQEKTVKVGRNSPCPCGSGRKFKRCCAR